MRNLADVYLEKRGKYMNVVFKFKSKPTPVELGDIVGSLETHIFKESGAKTGQGRATSRPDMMHTYFVYPRLPTPRPSYIIRPRGNEIAVEQTQDENNTRWIDSFYHASYFFCRLGQTFISILKYTYVAQLSLQPA